MDIASRTSTLGAILRDGFAQEAVSSTFLGWRVRAIREGMELLTSDIELSKLFPWRIFAEDGYGKGYEQEVGLRYKDDDERKWVFQYVATASDNADLAASRRLRLFLDALHGLETLAVRIARDVASEIDARSRGAASYGTHGSKLADPICVTRVLRYPPGKSHARRATTHIDRCYLTVHWWASHAGLLVYGRDGSWHGVNETADDSFAVFPGEKFAACSRGALDTYGTPHGVWCDEALLADRYAIVSFVHPCAQEDDCAWLRERASNIKDYEKRLSM